MKFGDALHSCITLPGKLFARQMFGPSMAKSWKIPSDATGYGQFALVMESKEVFKWVAWSTYDERLTQGGVLRLGAEYFQKEWEVVSLEDLQQQALESLNPLEQDNLARRQKEKANA